MKQVSRTRLIRPNNCSHQRDQWEYPRETPDGDQIDIAEVMDIRGALIQHHRIYWGWKGLLQIAPALTQRAAKNNLK